MTVGIPDVFGESQRAGLPFLEDIDQILIEQQAQSSVQIYTLESLRAILPNLQRAGVSSSLGFGKVWLWQRGSFKLKNGEIIHWRTFAQNLLLIESKDEAIFYTDATATTRRIVGNKLITTLYTKDGKYQFEIGLVQNGN